MLLAAGWTLEPKSLDFIKNAAATQPAQGGGGGGSKNKKKKQKKAAKQEEFNLEQFADDKLAQAVQLVKEAIVSSNLGVDSREWAASTFD